jgi:AsmA protein
MKRLLIAVLVVLALVGGLLVLLPVVLSSGPVKQRIADQLADWTGRKISYIGNPRVRLFPYLRIQIPNVTVGDPKGASNFISMESLSGSLRLAPLLFGRVEIAEFRLFHPRIHLRRTASQERNWDLSQVEQERRRPGPPAQLVLSRIRISDGTVIWDDAASGRYETISNIDLNLSWPSALEPIVGNGTFRWRDETVEFNGSIGDPTALNEARASPARIAIASTPIRASFSGNISRLAGLQFEGPANLSTPSLRRLIAWLGAPGEPGSTLGAAAIAGKLNWSGSTIAFNEARFELDGNAADGNVSAALDGARPAIHGTLALNRLDLTPYLEAFRADLNSAVPGTGRPISMPVLSAVDLDLRFSTDEVLLGSARVGDVAATVTVGNGKLGVDIGGAQLYSGTLAARLGGAMEGDAFVASAEAKVSAVPAGLALAELAGVTGLDGTGEATISVGGGGRTWNELAHKLAGTATVSLTDGHLAGLDLARLAAILEGRADSATPARAATAFGTAGATVTMANGLLKSEDLHAEGEGFRIDLTAEASLFDTGVSGLGTLTIGMTGAAPGTALPFELAGTWREPEVFPDLGRIIKRSDADPSANGPSQAAGAAIIDR